MEKKSLIKRIDEEKIIVIIRGITGEKLIRTVEALHRGGIGLAEITFDQSGKISDSETCTNISSLREKFDGAVEIGAGTVITTEQVHSAYNSGAKYIISPDTCREVIEETLQLEMVSIPGALTPTEAVKAYKWGADYVKLFPAGNLGISYIKSVMAPLNHIKMMAVGGVDINNIDEFIKIGVRGFGIGSNIVNKRLVDEGRFDELSELAEKYVKKVRD